MICYKILIKGEGNGVGVGGLVELWIGSASSPVCRVWQVHARDISRKLKENGAKNGSARARSCRVLPYSTNWHPVYSIYLGMFPRGSCLVLLRNSLETWFPYDYCNHWKMFTNCLGIFPSAVHNERTVSFDGCVTSFPISYTMLHSQHFFHISELKLSHQWLTHSMEVNYNNTVVIFLTC